MPLLYLPDMLCMLVSHVTLHCCSVTRNEVSLAQCSKASAHKMSASSVLMTGCNAKHLVCMALDAAGELSCVRITKSIGKLTGMQKHWILNEVELLLLMAASSLMQQKRL